MSMSRNDRSSAFEDWNMDNMVEVPMKHSGVRDLLRGRQGVDNILEPVDIIDNIMPSQLVHQAKKSKVVQITSDAALKAGPTEAAEFLNLQRLANANYLRDLYADAPDLAEKM